MPKAASDLMWDLRTKLSERDRCASRLAELDLELEEIKRALAPAVPAGETVHVQIGDEVYSITNNYDGNRLSVRAVETVSWSHLAFADGYIESLEAEDAAKSVPRL